MPILLYLLSVGTALMYTICRSQFLPCALFMGACTAGIFLLFYALRFKPLPTTVCVLALLVAAWALGSVASSWSPGQDMSFMNFLFSASATFSIVYASAAIFIFSLVIGFIGCYFSAISPRPCFLMLLMFIPMILSSRTSRELPVYFMLIMSGCFLFAVGNLAVPCPAEGNSFGGASGTRRVGVSSAAALVLTLIVAILPKDNTTPFKEYLDSFVPRNEGFYGGGGLTNFTNHSSVNIGENNPTDDLLFTVQTDRPRLLKCWAFDVYGEKGWTLYSGEYDFETGYANWKNYAAESVPSEYTYYYLYEYRERLMEENQELMEGISPEFPERTVTTINIKDNSSTRVVMHPTQTVSLYLPEVCGRSFRNPRDDIFTEFAFPQNASYSAVHSANGVNEDLMRRLDGDRFRGLLSDAYYSEIISQDTWYAITDELRMAENYRDVTSGGIPDEIHRLADEITAGLDNDYDKALAIEKWFGEAGFVYDLAFVPEQAGVEYFLFDSRRGICSDYASALTMLARAAGLPARYCEGYAVTPDTYDEEEGVYKITNQQAHAFTQIYIPGGGWLDFDGTKYAASAQEEVEGTPWWLYVIAGAVVAAVLIFVFHRQLGWAVFCAFYPMRSKSAKVRGVYFHARRLAASIYGAEEKTLACGEVRDILTKRLGMPQETERICSAADRLFYSRETADEDGRELLKALNALKKRKRRLK